MIKISTERRRPIVGVFVSNGMISLLNNQIHNFRSYFRLKQIALASRKTKIPVYFFGVRDLDMENKRIYGTYYHPSTQKWKSKYFPLPDILYDRGGGLRGYQRQKAKWLRKKFNKIGIKSINSQHYFDKWDMYKNLLKEKHLKKYLPHTRLFKSMDDLKEFLGLYPKVYLKVVNGSRGQKLLCIRKSSEGGYIYSYHGDRLVIGRKNTLTELYKFIKAFYENNGRDVIIQQGISLLKIKKQLVDLRAEVQRNKYGKLEIVAVPVRLGIRHSPITIHSDAYEFEEFFRKFTQLTGAEIKNLKGKIDKFLVDVYLCMEKYYGPFGEIGIDLGLDKDLNIWFIECNAKSAKVSLSKSCDKSTIERAFSNPLGYAKYLYDKKS